MSFAGDVWVRLASIDVGDHIKIKEIKYKNGKNSSLSYLSWAWAWGIIMTNYPESVYKFYPVEVFDGGTAEVWCEVIIVEGEKTFSRKMWLPIMSGFTNSAVIKPTSRDINDARMRCLTKCLAMFGLGHYIYAGEDLPDTDVVDMSVAFDKNDSINCIKESIESSDLYCAAEAWAELTKKEKIAIWSSFSTKEQDVMKSEEFKEINVKG